jgi:hypothetical protein
MTTTLTYGQLYDQLDNLNFRRSEIQKNGKTHYLFEHKTMDSALIVLPKHTRDDLVEPFFIRSVLATLKSHDLVSDVNPLEVIGNTRKPTR